MLDQSTLETLVSMLTKQVADLESRVVRLSESENDAWSRVEEARNETRDAEQRLNSMANQRRETSELYTLRAQVERLESENETLRNNARELGNKLLSQDVAALAIRDRFRNGDLRGQKIAAIKAVREACWCGLREAKDFIEADPPAA